MSTENKQYHIVMDSMTAMQIMVALDMAACATDDEIDKDMFTDIVHQIDKEHTRFFNEENVLEKTMNTEQKPIDKAITEIQHDRLITGIAFQLIEEADKTSLPESMLIEQVEVRMRELIRERMEKKVTNEG